MEISLLGILLLLVIAAICGAIAKAMVGYRRGGLLASIGFGFVGAFVGVLLANATGLPTLLAINAGGMVFPIVWAILGAVLTVGIVAAVSRNSSRTHHRHSRPLV